MHATDIVGYIYRAETLCPGCIVDALDPQATDYYGGRVESWLDDVAFAMSIDRYDEHCFDSDEFPKVIFGSQLEDDRCDSCGEAL